MLRGHVTNKFYEECLNRGLCKDHLKELEVNDEAEGRILQRKAILFIRLQIFGPLLFDKPYSFEKMKVLFSKCKHFPSKDSKRFQDAIMILDSVVVYTLCYLSSVCCAGILYQSGTSRELVCPNMKKIVELLSKTILHEEDISHFSPILEKNFRETDKSLIKISFVTVLLHVRNMTINMKLDQALKRIDTDLISVSRESEKWKSIGNDSFKEGRYEEAVNAFTSAINYNPYSIYLLKRRALAYHRLNMYQKAALDYYLLLVIDPTTMKTYSQLCYCFFQNNSFSDSIAIADFAMEKFHSSRESDAQTYFSIKVLRDSAEACLQGKGQLSSKESVSDTVPVLNCSTSEEEDTSKEDVPDLVEASDSESETQDDLELDASNCEDEQITVKKSRAERKSSVETHSKPQKPMFKDPKEEKCHNLNVLLKEGSGHLLDGLGQLAIPCFQDALNEIKMYPEVYNYQECDIMSIRYAYGCALCKSKDYDDLLKAISVFKDIVEEHSASRFPAAYYGMALAYKKFNWFKEALGCLNAIPDILSKDTPPKVCTWPGLAIFIEETRPTHLKRVTADLIKECENAPPPDAVCRYDKCTLRPSMYYSDPDFKGLYSAKCTEQCFLQYHPQCWKILRSIKQFTDKAFLEQNCFTPDCEGVVCNIVCISKDGNVEKTFSVADTKNLPKQKKSKASKKTEVKEEKKRWRKDSSSKSVEEASAEIFPEDEEKTKSTTLHTYNDKMKDNDSNKMKVEYSFEKVEDIPLPPEEEENNVETPSQLSVMAEPFIMLKKDKLEDNLSSKVSSKLKEHKKVKNTLSLDEFLESHKTDSSEKDECTSSKSKTNLQNGVSFSFTEPVSSQKLQTEEKNPNGASLFYDPPLEGAAVESMKKLIYDSMKNFLQKHGPLHIDDPLITSELSSYPHAANRLIADSGGIGELLKQNLNFALVGDTYVCIVSDVVAAYEKQSADSLKRVKIKPIPVYSSYSTNDGDELKTPTLNPNAKEYCFSQNNVAKSVNTSYLVRASQSTSTASNLNQNHLDSGVKSKEDGVCDSEKSSSLDSVLIAEGAVRKVSCPQQVVDLLAKLTACLTLYESDELSQFRPFIEKSLKPFSIVKDQAKAGAALQTDSQEKNLSESHTKCSEDINILEGTIHDLLNDKKVLEEKVQSLQHECQVAEDNLVEYTTEIANYKTKIRNSTKSIYEKNISESHTKCNEDINNLERIIHDLSNDKKVLEEEIQSLQHECEVAENNRMEHTTEIANYKTKIQNLTKSMNNQKTEFEEEHSNLLKEKDNLLEKLKISESKEKGFKSQTEKLGKDMKSLQLKLDDLVKSASDNQHVVLEKDKQIDTLIEKMKSLNNEKAELITRAIYAEDLLLLMKKSENLKRIDARIAEATMIYNNVLERLKTIPLGLSREPELFANKMKNYVNNLTENRNKFTVQIDEQISQVRKGSPLASLKSVDISFEPYPQMNNTQQGPILNPTAPPFRIQPEMYNAAPILNGFPKTHARGLGNANSVLHPTTADLITRVQNQLAAHPIVKPVPIHPDKIQVQSEAGKVSMGALTEVKPMGEYSVMASGEPSAWIKTESSESFASRLHRELPLAGSRSSTSFKPPAIKQEDMTSSISAISHPRLNEETVQKAISIPKSEEANMKVQQAVSRSNPRIDEVNQSIKGAVSQESLRPEPKNSYEKLLLKLKNRFPQFTQSQLVDNVKELREQKRGKLSGLSMDTIVQEVSLLIQSKEANQASETESKMRMKPAMLVNRNFTSSDTKNKQPPADGTTQSKKCPWGDASSSQMWTGESAEEDCSICTEDMSKNSYKVPCGHRFHFKCIKAWLAKKSDCPICRVHLLLPEDYPALS